MHIHSLEGVSLDAGIWAEIEAMTLMVRFWISTWEWHACRPHVPHSPQSPRRALPQPADNLNNYQGLS